MIWGEGHLLYLAPSVVSATVSCYLTPPESHFQPLIVFTTVLCTLRHWKTSRKKGRKKEGREIWGEIIYPPGWLLKWDKRKAYENPKINSLLRSETFSPAHNWNQPALMVRVLSYYKRFSEPWTFQPPILTDLQCLTIERRYTTHPVIDKPTEVNCWTACSSKFEYRKEYENLHSDTRCSQSGFAQKRVTPCQQDFPQISDYFQS